MVSQCKIFSGGKGVLVLGTVIAYLQTYTCHGKELDNVKTGQEETPLLYITEVEDTWTLLPLPFVLLQYLLAAQGDTAYKDFCVDECA